MLLHVAHSVRLIASASRHNVHGIAKMNNGPCDHAPSPARGRNCLRSEAFLDALAQPLADRMAARGDPLGPRLAARRSCSRPLIAISGSIARFGLDEGQASWPCGRRRSWASAGSKAPHLALGRSLARSLGCRTGRCGFIGGDQARRLYWLRFAVKAPRLVVVSIVAFDRLVLRSRSRGSQRRAGPGRSRPSPRRSSDEALHRRQAFNSVPSTRRCSALKSSLSLRQAEAKPETLVRSRR